MLPAQASPTTIELLRAVDLAFERVLGSRYAGGVCAAPVSPAGVGPSHMLRGGDAAAEHLLVAYATDAAGARECATARPAGLVIGRVGSDDPRGEDVTVRVETELLDAHDPNGQEGDPLHAGIRLVPVGGSLLVLRSAEQARDRQREATLRLRGQLPGAARYKPRAGLGLGGGSHRPAPPAMLPRPVAGRLLAELGRLVLRGSAEEERPRGAVVGLLPA